MVLWGRNGNPMIAIKRIRWHGSLDLGNGVALVVVALKSHDVCRGHVAERIGRRRNLKRETFF